MNTQVLKYDDVYPGESTDNSHINAAQQPKPYVTKSGGIVSKQETQRP